MGNPSKPTNVNVAELKKQLTVLQGIQKDLASPRPGGWDAIGTTVETDIQGMQDNVANTVGNRYADNVTYLRGANTSLVAGVNALVTMLDTTIRTHSSADQHAADAATQTNTTQANTTQANTTQGAAAAATAG